MERYKEKVLIVGGAGFLGSHVVAELQVNYRVCVLEKSGCNLSRIKDYSDRIELFYINEINLNQFLKDHQFDYIINCSVLYGPGDKLSTLIANNVVMPVQLIESCGTAVKAFINTDSFYNKPENHSYSNLKNYTLTKKHLEEYLKSLQSRLKIINLKLEHIFGPGDSYNKFMPVMINNLYSNLKEIDMTPGEQVRDFIYVKDVAKAFAIVLQNISELHEGFNEFSVGTGQATSIKDFTCKMKSILNSSSELKFGSIPYRENEIMHSVGNPGPLLKLGWKIEYSLQIGLTETIEFEKSRLADDKKR